MERKLASIQKIDKLIKIENSDYLELASVLGWKAIVKRDEFVPGQKCIYIEYDAVLPDHEIFEFMRSKKFRVKTMKMRGQLSQGLVLPLNTLEYFIESIHWDEINALEIGFDLTDTLRIVKYEIPVPVEMAGQIKGNFPHFIPKTDELRLQSYPGVLDEIRGLPYYITQKQDGTSATYYMKDGQFGVCSRKLELKDTPNNIYWKIARKYDIEKKYYDWSDIAIQGEIVGPGIQKNRLGLKNHELFVFNVWNIPGQFYYSLADALTIVKQLGLQFVPFVEVEEDNGFDYTLEQLLKLTEGVYLGTNNQREGIVIRSLYERESIVLQGRLSFKVINDLYLLKEIRDEMVLLDE